jgi:D-glycero-D-manno-heptose 1,7-bisphosphate phosphatase
LAPTAFLDRDGTINVKPPEGDYVTRPEDLALLPGAAEAIGRLNAAGWLVVVVTNQRGVALGRMTAADLAAVHARLEAELAAAGARLNGIYACLHDEDSCDCRKPATGLFEQARADHPGIDLAEAVMIGDSWRDMDAARALGLRGIEVGDSSSLADAVDDLLTAGWG